MLSRLVLVDGSLSAGDVLPESLNHLQVCFLCVTRQWVRVDEGRVQGDA